MPNEPKARYLAVVSATAEGQANLEAALSAKGITVEDRFDFIRTLVLSGDEAAILALPQTVPGIKSVEREGEVHVPE